MKYGLFLMICSAVNNICSPTYSDYVKYDDFHSCILSGATKVVEMIKEIDQKEFNDQKIVVRFFCQEEDENQVNKTSTQGIELS